MPRCDGQTDGFVIDTATASLLMAAETVTVVTNSRAIPSDYFEGVVAGLRDAFVVFNRHRFTIGEPLAARTLWVHRLDEATGRYFGESPESRPGSSAFHHIRVASAEPREIQIPPGGSYLSYRANLPVLAGYPLGRKLLIPQRGIRRIVSPSTGFATISLLDELRRRGAIFRIRAVGVGREYNGWPGHDWAFERRRLRQLSIDFRTPGGYPDHRHTFLDHVPYELVRAAGKIRLW